MGALRRGSLFGVPIDALRISEVLSVVEAAIRDRRSLLVGVVNAAKLVNMRRDASLGRAVLAADMILADGMAVVWACRVLGRPLPERVAGIDLMAGMLERGARRGWRFYCLGAHEDVLSAAVERMTREYPGITIAGCHHGYFSSAEEPRVAEAIRASSADVLLVAMSSPKKELFLARWGRWMGVPVCHGVGGAFDVLAGRVQRAPTGWQRLGLEWLYRVVQEPRRMWRRYLVTNTLFCGMVVAELFGAFRVARSS